MPLFVKIRLSLMMFLEFFVWGSWYVTMGTFLGANIQAKDQDISLAFSTQSLGAILAPFLVGLIADRYFQAQKILGSIHLVGAVMLYGLHQAVDFSAFFPILLGYMILFMPTLALVNSISFNQMAQPEKEFSGVRIWGTIGWIAAGILISTLAWDSQEGLREGLLQNTWKLAAGASLLLGIYSFTLPATPPQAKSNAPFQLKEVLGLDALRLLTHRNYAIFFLSSILICIPLAFYYQNASPFLTELGVENSTGKMALGQVSEVLFLVALPFFFTRFGLKKTLAVAMLAWVIRYLFFAFGDTDSGTWMLLAGIANGMMFTVTMSLPLDVADSPIDVGAAAGMMLFVGYLITACAPSALGWVRDLTGSFDLVLLAFPVAAGLFCLLAMTLSPARLQRGIRQP
jgi:nucleoside transporter